MCLPRSVQNWGKGAAAPASPVPAPLLLSVVRVVIVLLTLNCPYFGDEALNFVRLCFLTFSNLCLQLEEERLATIERDNRILLEKMSFIMRTSGRIDNKNDYEYKRCVS